MAQYAYVDGFDDPQPPTRDGQRGQCVQKNCNHPMYPRSLSSEHQLAHWVHFHGSGHNYGTGPMGEWHAGIQDLFEHYGAEVERPRTAREGAKHRADIVCPDGRIVEAQTSYLAARHLRSREDTYGEMCWLYGDMPQIATLKTCIDSDPTRFYWPGANHRLLEHQRPVFIDRDVHGIYQLVWLERRTTSDERTVWTCRLRKVAERQRDFVEAIMAGRPFGDPPQMLTGAVDKRVQRLKYQRGRMSLAEFKATYRHDRVYGTPADMEMRRRIAEINAALPVRRHVDPELQRVREVNAIFYPEPDGTDETVVDDAVSRLVKVFPGSELVW